MSPSTSRRVLSHVALAGARKLVGAGWAGDAPLPPGGACASPGVVPRITSETTTTLRAKEVVRMIPPGAVPAAALFHGCHPDDRQGRPYSQAASGICGSAPPSGARGVTQKPRRQNQFLGEVWVAAPRPLTPRRQWLRGSDLNRRPLMGYEHLYG